MLPVTGDNGLLKNADRELSRRAPAGKFRGKDAAAWIHREGCPKIASSAFDSDGA